MTDRLEEVMSQATDGEVSLPDLKRQLNDKKDTVKVHIHNAMMWVFCTIATLLAIGLALCVLSYFCYIIRGVDAPATLTNFLGKVIEWVLVSGASFFVALKIRHFCE